MTDRLIERIHERLAISEAQWDSETYRHHIREINSIALDVLEREGFPPSSSIEDVRQAALSRIALSSRISKVNFIRKAESNLTEGKSPKTRDPLLSYDRDDRAHQLLIATNLLSFTTLAMIYELVKTTGYDVAWVNQVIASQLFALRDYILGLTANRVDKTEARFMHEIGNQYRVRVRTEWQSLAIDHAIKLRNENPRITNGKIASNIVTNWSEIMKSIKLSNIPPPERSAEYIGDKIKEAIEKGELAPER
jgi:hypothetical protein